MGCRPCCQAPGHLEQQAHTALTFFLSSCPFLRSLLAIMTPVLRVSNTGSLLLAAAGTQGQQDGFSYRTRGDGAPWRGDNTYRAAP